jgi:O-antigen biosynthesis protein
VSAKGGKVVESWRPTKVIIADFVDGTLVTDPGTDIGKEIGRLDVFVRREGRPIGMVSLDVSEDVSDLAQRLVDAAAQLPSPVEAPWSREDPIAWPKVTVAIPTVFGRLEMLRKAVASLARLDYPEFEIVLVDNRHELNEEDHAYVRTATERPVRILHESERGISAARNRSLRDCEDPFIAFTDDDVQVEPEWLRQIIRPFLDNASVACVSGVVIPSELSSPEQSQFEDFFGGFHRSFDPVLYSAASQDQNDPLFPYAPGKFGTGNNMAFRVSVLRELGGFDVALGTGTPARGGEDLATFILILLGGGSIAFEPSAVVRHSHRGTGKEFRDQVLSYGVGLAAMYTALFMADKRHRRNIVQRLPRALHLFFRSGNGTVEEASSDVSVPALLRVRQAAGILAGPALYLQSRREHPRPPVPCRGSSRGAMSLTAVPPSRQA